MMEENCVSAQVFARVTLLEPSVSAIRIYTPISWSSTPGISTSNFTLRMVNGGLMWVVAQDCNNDDVVLPTRNRTGNRVASDSVVVYRANSSHARLLHYRG